MTGAAGFKRDSVAGRGVPDPGLVGFTYNDPSNVKMHRVATDTSHSSVFGMDRPTEDHKNAPGMLMSSPNDPARHSFT